MNKALFVAGLAGLAAVATAQVKITETFVGLTGEDGNSDWIEITNISGSVVDTGSFLFDDENPSVGSAGALTSILLNPGESAIFLIDAAAADDTTYANSTDEFLAIWGFNPGDIKIGLTNGGGNLSQNGDSVFVGVDNGGSFDVIDELTFTGAIGGLFETIEDTNNGLRNSVLGENGAFASNQFFNDNIGTGPDFLVSLVGSPGVIPAPASAALLGLGGLVAIRRRR